MPITRITSRDLIRTVAKRWLEQYRIDIRNKPKGNHASVYNRLRRLNPETATTEEVTAIIGNSSWTAIMCDGHEHERALYVDDAFEIDNGDYSSHVCRACVERMARDMGILQQADPSLTGSVYTAVHEPPGSLIGGWHIHRNDPGEVVTHILAQGMGESEAHACVEALNRLAGG